MYKFVDPQFHSYYNKYFIIQALYNKNNIIERKTTVLKIR